MTLPRKRYAIWKEYFDTHPQFAGLLAIVSLCICILNISDTASVFASPSAKTYTPEIADDVAKYVKTGDYTVEEIGKANIVTSSFVDYFNYFDATDKGPNPDSMRLLPVTILGPYLAMISMTILVVICIAYIVWFVYNYWDTVIPAYFFFWVTLGKFVMAQLVNAIINLLKGIRFTFGPFDLGIATIKAFVIDPFGGLRTDDATLSERLTTWYTEYIKKPFGKEADVLFNDIMQTISAVSESVFALPNALLNFITEILMYPYKLVVSAFK